MTIEALFAKAKLLGINPDGLSIKEIIRFVQVLEHNFPCFNTTIRYKCTQEQCCFRQSCMGIHAEHVI